MNTTQSKHCWSCRAPILHPTELTVWELLVDPRELTFKEIAYELGLAFSTVKNVSAALYNALGVKGRQGAVQRWKPVE